MRMATDDFPLEDVFLARSGDRFALERLTAWVMPFLEKLARGKVGPQLLEVLRESDLVQETCRKYLGKVESFQGRSYGEFVTWLKVILDRVIQDVLRRVPNVPKGGGWVLDDAVEKGVPDPGPGVDSQVVQRETRDRVWAAVEALPEVYRLVLTCRYREGSDWDTVARKLGRSTDAVQKLHVRALVQLRGILGADS